MSDCMINPYSSGVCVLGTKSCVMKHTGIVERDKRIAELEAQITRLESSVSFWQSRVVIMADDKMTLVAENADLKARIDRWNSGGNYVATNAKIERLKSVARSRKEKMEIYSIEAEELEAEIEQLQALIEGSEAYLKEDETIAQCLERNRRDAANARIAESKYKKEAEKLREEVEQLQWVIRDSRRHTVGGE